MSVCACQNTMDQKTSNNCYVYVYVLARFSATITCETILNNTVKQKFLEHPSTEYSGKCSAVASSTIYVTIISEFWKITPFIPFPYTSCLNNPSSSNKLQPSFNTLDLFWTQSSQFKQKYTFRFSIWCSTTCATFSQAHLHDSHVNLVVFCLWK